MSSNPRTIVIYGSGLAAQLTAAAWASQMSETDRVRLISPNADQASDLFYGSCTAPSGYEFFRAIGLDEPVLMSQTEATFSFGTEYKNWPGVANSWVQCFHLPLPLISGVPLQHFLTARGLPLEPYLVSAQAALSGRFAHPPNDPKSPLSRAEYGYHFSVSEISKLLVKMNAARSVETLQEAIKSVHVDANKISCLELASGEKIKADLFVDCSGTGRLLVGALDTKFQSLRRLQARLLSEPVDQTAAPCRSLSALTDGWRSVTPLQSRIETVTICQPNPQNLDTDTLDELVVEADMGFRDRPWRGNCVAIGHAAWMLEPLTTAPMMMLQRDIERLLDLIPVAEDFRVEEREYNRRYLNDLEHISAFQRAFFEIETPPQSGYWKDATGQPVPEKLRRKLTQFESRGILARYDLEPFNEEDWMILHNGMGLKPRRYDRQVDGIAAEDIDRQLASLAGGVAQLIPKMPPHHIYMTNLKRYLEKQKHG